VVQASLRRRGREPGGTPSRTRLARAGRCARQRQPVLSSLAWLASLAALAALTLSPRSASADLPEVRRAGLLRWGGDQEGGGPYVFPRDDDPRKVTGFEVDLADRLAERLGVRGEFTQGQWDKLPDMLRTAKIDVVLNGYELTPEKLETMSATVPYYVYALQLLARGNDTRFTSWEDLATLPGGKKARVGVLGGSAAESEIRRRCGEACELVSYDGNTEAMRGVETSTLDATVQDTPIWAFYRSRFPALAAVGEPASKGYYVMFVPREAASLGRALDGALIAMILSGEIEHIDRRYGIWDERQAELAAIAQAGKFYGRPWHTPTATPHAASGSASASASGAPAASAAPALPAGHASSAGSVSATAAPAANGDGAGAAVDDVVTIGVRKRGLEVVRAYGGILLQSAGLTVLLSLLSFPLAIAVGLMVAVGRLYGPRWMSLPLRMYVEFLRGTPLMLQLYFIFFVLPEAGIAIPAFWTGVLGLAINYSAYESEIYRAGLQAIPPGQLEAALSLGMARSAAIRRILVPQAVRIVVPPVVNDFIALFKDTSVCSVITLVELTKRFSILSLSTQATIELMVMTGLLYLAMSYPMSMVSRRLELSLGSERGAA
jgi:polar amino acid transport system substrate-binding protein